MTTSILAAASGLESMGQQAYLLIAALGGFGSLGLAIIVALKNAWKVGIGSGIAAFFAGIALSVLIANAVGIHDAGTKEFHDRTGYNPGPYGTLSR